MHIEKEEDMIDLPSGFAHWTVAAMLAWVAYQAIRLLRSQRSLKKEIDELKSMLADFLKPVIRFKVNGLITKEIKMKDTEKATATLELDDAKGFPTGDAFDQPPVWEIDDAEIASLAPSADGLSCDVIGGKP